MKAENLQIMADRGIPVPPFITVCQGQTPDLSFSAAERFAVRSSFAGEDGRENSYAGQFETLLNVARPDVPAAVERVRASYMRETAYKERSPAPAGEGLVIVQEMLNSELSGVIFTANPMGILNETVITVGKGLGSGVVEDRVRTLTCFCNRDENRFFLREQPDPAVGLTFDCVPWERLIALSDRIADIFQVPCDIEFAVQDGQIYILQSRPITALDCDHVLVLDNSNIVESYPGVCLPMTQSFVKKVYRDIFTACVTRLTHDPDLIAKLGDTLENMVAVSGGALYYQIGSWYTLLGLLPFSKRITRVWQEMLGVENRLVSRKEIPISRFSKIRVALSALWSLARTPARMKKLNRYFGAAFPLFRAQVDASDSVAELLALCDAIEGRITSVWDVTLMNDLYAFLFTALAGGSQNRRISDIRNMASLRPARAMDGLIVLAGESGTDSAAFAARMAEYIEEYGDRGPGELKLETPTFRTNPDLLLAYVQAECAADPRPDPGPGRREHPTEKESKERKLRLPHPIVAAARRGILNREQSRLNRTRLFGLVRNIYRKVGEILVRDGRIECVEDVFYLFPEEIAELYPQTDKISLPEPKTRKISSKIAQKLQFSPETGNGLLQKSEKSDRLPPESEISAPSSEKIDLSATVKARKDEYALLREQYIPRRLVFAGRIISLIRRPVDNAPAGLRLTGIAASPGRVRAEVVVLTEAAPAADVDGKILVTHTTDPGWVFLIRRCAGIIVEQGSILSHTAIISRELCKPSLVNVKDAARILRTGDFVELDALSGQVTRLERREDRV